MKKTIIIFLSLFISCLIITLPYKEYPTLSPETTIKITIYREIIKIFIPGMWRHIAFVFVLLPTILLFQITPSLLRIYKKALFMIEGVAAFFAAFFMFIIMSVNPLSFAQAVIIKPMFYLSFCWVLFASVGAILLMAEKVYNKVSQFLYG